MSTPPIYCPHTQRPVRLNLSAAPFQQNNSVFLLQQININRFSSQPNKETNHYQLSAIKT
jgi:hypothetical protein